jgi:hypothetical protein
MIPFVGHMRSVKNLGIFLLLGNVVRDGPSYGLLETGNETIWRSVPQTISSHPSSGVVEWFYLMRNGGFPFDFNQTTHPQFERLIE